MRLSKKQAKFSCMVGLFLYTICKNSKKTGITVTLGEVYRTEYQQKRYVKLGKSKTLRSKHCQRLAIDLNLFIEGKYITDPKLYRYLGEIWESLGGRWGGRFGVKREEWFEKVGWDSNHFEYLD